VNPDHFIGRDAEARAILSNVSAQRSTLIIGEAGVGKSALLAYLEPVLQEEGTLIHTGRVAPFGTFLKELFTGLWDAGLIPEQSRNQADDLKLWGKNHPSNDEKAKALLNLIAKAKNVIVVIDDTAGITPTTRPWLEHLTEICTVVAAVDPAALTKSGTKRFWKRFDEIQLGRLPKSEAAALLEGLMSRYRVNADEPEVYRRRVLELAQGSPFELERLVKYHSSETLVNTRELGSYSQQFVERDIKQIALAPVLLILSALVIAGRYIGRAQDNQDLYVISGLLLAFMIVLSPWLKATLKPRSR
jgi:predicted ATPase